METKIIPFSKTVYLYYLTSLILILLMARYHAMFLSYLSYLEKFNECKRKLRIDGNFVLILLETIFVKHSIHRRSINYFILCFMYRNTKRAFIKRLKASSPAFVKLSSVLHNLLGTVSGVVPFIAHSVYFRAGA